MPPPLPKDATFKDLRTPRVETERFLRNVIGVMHKAQKEHGPIMVRMGITGTGQAPNYRIEDPDGQPLQAIDGATHAPWPEDARFSGSDNWSSAAMSRGDVEDILSSMSGYPPPGTAKP